MSFERRVRPEILPGLEVCRAIGLDEQGFVSADIPRIRGIAKQAFEAALAAMPSNDRVTQEDRHIPGPSGAPDVLLRIYRPAGQSGALPCVYWIHGGGMVFAEMAFDDPDCQAYAEAVGCVVVSVEYRLAPEYPYPAGVNDCYAGLRWTFENAEALGIDPQRIAIAGRSGGGCLAAAVSLMSRDAGGPPLAFQLLIYPMLDDRNETPSSLEFDNIPSWSRTHNLAAWRALLGSLQGSGDVPSYAAPARARDLRGLPPTFIQVGELEVFRDESINYAARLLAAGVPCELHVYPGLYHGSDMFNPTAASSCKLANERFDALKTAFNSAAGNAM